MWGIVKKLKKNSTLIKISQVQPLGAFKRSEHETEKKNLSDERLDVYKSIFRKLSLLLFGIEISSMGVLKSWKLSFDNENLLRSTIEGKQVDFSKSANLSSDPVIAYFGVL